jgi:plasmid stability protein
MPSIADSRPIDGQAHPLQLEVLLCYCEDMKNITVSLDEEIYRRARIKAAERDTSVSALVKGFLVALASEEPASQALEREERELRARIRSFSAGNRLSRDDAHGRDA